MNTSYSEEDNDSKHDFTDGDEDASDGSSDKIIINVGGICHVTRKSTLVKKPGTRLGDLAQKHLTAGTTKTFYFDRHPGVFSAVIDFYRSGELHVPLDVCGAVVKRELDWWKVDDSLIEPCCWIKYSKYIDTQKTLADFNQSVQTEDEKFRALQSLTGWKYKQARIWMILDYPRSSKLALAYAVTSFLFVVASIAGFCLETLPDMADIENVTRRCGENDPDETIELQMPHQFLTILDYICTAYFSIELIVRIVFAPDKTQFFRNAMNIIDILALLPLYVQNIFELTDQYNCLSSHRAVIETIFILRIIRICRIFHILKHYKALKILVHAIKASIQELLMLSIFLFIAMLIFSTMIYYAERTRILAGESEQDNPFSTIPIGFWWSIITMTTVGYGDVHPKTPMGYIVGALCAVAGVLLVALTIPVISNNFALFYNHARTRDTLAQKDKAIHLRKLSMVGTNRLQKVTVSFKKALELRPLFRKSTGEQHTVPTVESTEMTRRQSGEGMAAAAAAAADAEENGQHQNHALETSMNSSYSGQAVQL